MWKDRNAVSPGVNAIDTAEFLTTWQTEMLPIFIISRCSLPPLTTHLNRKPDPGGYFLLRNLQSAHCQCIVTMSLTRYSPCKETDLKEKTEGKRYFVVSKDCVAPQVQKRFADHIV